MSLSPVARIRRFNRAVTTETGALDQSFLGRGRPLGAARVLNAIGPEGRAVSEVRDFLDLDTGLMSRLLRGLEEEGLIAVSEDPEDKRRRHAALTPAGLSEYEAYEALSDTRAQALLDRHPHPEQLLAAMDLIASALGRDRIEVLEMDPDSAMAQDAMQSYYSELAVRFSMGFDPAKAARLDASDMRPPRGAFLVAMADGLPSGCVGLKGTDTSKEKGGYAEIKRLWVAPSARGLGLAKRLMSEIETRAREIGITTLRLDTNSALPEAAGLYQRLGWSEIERFNDDPYPDLFFEKAM
ncbi:bifunctional helix-turn-helix transcriptional regulator/GNAT family N-acetyltransferase [Celeribacter neptunius]|uniref:Transcriptional regulator, MarR family with acetyltransferase activity n=1 Tax=Celeribacter neptunius TaxID=588602 RepID=A0A1I3VC97_9RHOB|nr:bifunctional helix-turn-helix transcriptional regulator/GNAT family N-acetyltransferase [Celeribacter neptunius]SFJ92643.1 transcriptional regulator, MarR family with acetyltransferase activity [Celeribacter neptunius]